MSATAGDRPDTSEYDVFYERYVGRIGTGPIVSILVAQGHTFRDLISRLIRGGGDYSYAPGKWSVKDICGHLCDSERIFGMRAACIARGEVAELPGFEQDDYVAAGNFGVRKMDSLMREFESLRMANVELLSGLAPEDWEKTGRVSGARVSVRAIGWILAGHVDHHLAVLDERYSQAFIAR